MGKIAKIYKKLHKWPGLIISILLLYYGATGIFMNHRETFAGIDVNRSVLPKDFQYRNWNNAAVKGNLILSEDSILIYGNIGIWLTDSTYSSYQAYMDGIQEGADNRKVFDVHRVANGDLYTATQFGLYAYKASTKRWEKLKMDVKIKRFVALESRGDTIYALNRSYLFQGISTSSTTRFEKIELAKPANYKKEVSLFETLWQIHSGEILGLPGKLFVDLLGLITIFLSITGIVYFFFPGWIKRRKRKAKQVSTHARVNRWSLKWHNKAGAWLFVFLIVLFFSGMFLRPPLLIAIARSKVAPIKYSHLDQPNPWHDKLRDLHFDSQRNEFILASSEGIFSLSDLRTQPIRFSNQAPISVMGINVLEEFHNGAYLIGSFSGLFIWHPDHHEIYDYASGKLYQGNTGGRPIGDWKISGLIQKLNGEKFMVEYDRGMVSMNTQKTFPSMPDNVIKAAQMPLWNLSLEVHTGRFFRFLLSDFYILLVPLSSLIAIMVVLSGYLFYRKKFKRKRNKKQN